MENEYVIQNPDFDELFFFFDIEVKAHKEEFRENGEGNFIKKGNPNTAKFVSIVKEKLLSKKKRRWPYKENLVVCIGISGAKNIYGSKDVDNMAKSILDSFKEIVFEDDKQIHALIVSKHFIPDDRKGFCVGIRLIKDKIDKYYPKFFMRGSENNIWAEELKEKFKDWDEDFNGLEEY